MLVLRAPSDTTTVVKCTAAANKAADKVVLLASRVLSRVSAQHGQSPTSNTALPATTLAITGGVERRLHTAVPSSTTATSLLPSHD